MVPPRAMTAIAAVLTVAGGLLGAGCGSGGTAAAPATATSPPATTTASADTGTLPAPATSSTTAVVTPPPPTPPVPVDEADGRDRGGVGGGGGGHGGGGGDAPVQFPPGWPADLFLPPGTLLSAQGSVGHWTAMLLVSGNAQRALETAERYFRSAGYAQVRSGVLQRGARRVTIVTENLDHSDARTTLVVSADG